MYLWQLPLRTIIEPRTNSCGACALTRESLAVADESVRPTLSKP